jgi:hypothetical protein
VTDQVKSNRKWIVTGLNRTKPCLLLEKIAVEIAKVKNEKATRMRSPTHLSLQQLLKSMLLLWKCAANVAVKLIHKQWCLLDLEGVVPYRTHICRT